MTNRIKPYAWVVRFDVAPLWVADGFTLSDDRALEMLGREVGHACMGSELAARVLAAPPPLKIAREQGYGTRGHAVDQAARIIVSGTPHAFVHRSESASKGTLDRAITDAIELIDSVAFVRDEGDNSASVLSALRKARGVLRGEEPISDIEWAEAGC